MSRAVIASWYQRSFAQVLPDQAAIGLAFYDSLGAQLGSDVFAPLVSTATTGWTLRTLAASAPDETATVRVYQQMHRRTGTDNDGYVDDISLTVDGGAVALTNPGAETHDSTGWTNVTGALDTALAGSGGFGGNAFPPAHSGSYFFWGGQNLDTLAYQDVAIVPIGSGGGGDVCVDLSGYTDIDIAPSEGAVDTTWPVDLQPRNAGLHAMYASLSGGPSSLGLEPVVSSAAGYWRFSFEAVPVNTKTRILAFRQIAAQLAGRIGVCLVPLFDGKRAPQGASVVASGQINEGATSGALQFNAGGPPLPGMHFSAGERAYRIIAVGAESSGDTYPVMFWPPIRTHIADGDALDFATPHCRMRLATDGAMALTLEDLKFGSVNIDWVEDI